MHFSMRYLAVWSALLSTIFVDAASQKCEMIALPVCNGTEELTENKTFNVQDFVQSSKSSISALREIYLQLLANQTEFDVHLSDQIKGSKQRLAQLDDDLSKLNDTIIALSAIPTLPLTSTVSPGSTISDCSETKENGPFVLNTGEKVYCSQGWTVFQRRDGSISDFHRKTWEEYARGFGNVGSEFWMGLRKLHKITKKRTCRLRVDLRSYDDEYAYAEYSKFIVADEISQFRVNLGGYSGTAGDSFLSAGGAKANINGMGFTARDRDNDLYATGNCANEFGNYGGWWHNSCSYAKPNAIYGRTTNSWSGIIWHSWKRRNSLKTTTLKVRCD